MVAEFRSLPSVDRVLLDERALRAASELGAESTARAVRDELTYRRAAIAAGAPPHSFDEIVDAALRRAYAALAPSLRPVINATGVIIHTNLGRAPLSDDAIAAMSAVARGYSNLEYNLEAGERGSRHEHVESLLRLVTGAEAAMAVNNNASALLLVLSALARDREVVISRGQLVEIGGGFRIPDVMRQSGAALVEVGTTNRTYLRDYESAISDTTAALMRVHASNFRVIGFTAGVETAALAGLAHERGLLLLDDLGSGCLLDTATYGLAREPTPQESVADGADIVMFSGDKLLGGPQAGIIVGRADLITLLKRHPLARALRMDKASIAALNATLLHYVKGDAVEKVPVWRMIAASQSQLRRRARRLARAAGAGATVVAGRSMVGGGSLPEESLPAHLVALPPQPTLGLEDLARRLRLAGPAVVGRIEHDRLLLDLRTVDPRDDAKVRAALLRALVA
jgi:L-seryl-tRNA(Ser) seleniumtransferase